MDRRLLCRVICAVVAVAVSVNAQAPPCTTPTNERGTCVLISGCGHLSRLVDVEPVPSETIQYLESLQCGMVGLEPQVCCAPSTANVAESAPPCRTPNGTEGACVAVDSCAPYYATIMNRSRSEDDNAYIRRSRCGDGAADGQIRVCCPRATPTQQPLETIPRSSTSCRTSDGQQGACILLSECRPFQAILADKPVSRDNVRMVVGSQCGQQAGRPKVCCPTTLAEKMMPIGRPTRLGSLPDGDDCGKQVISAKIRNGNRTSIYEFPWMAMLRYSRTGMYQCGGALISRRYVLTAAHCVVGARLAEKLGNVTTVRLGEHNVNTDPDCFTPQPNVRECNKTPQDIPVEEIVYHDRWVPDTENLHNDIALIRLSRDAEITEFVRPICVARQDDTIAEGTNVYAAGWGSTEKDLVGFSPEKLKIRIPVTSRRNCSDAYRSTVVLHEGQFCAGGGANKQNVCQGDSGGPIMVHNRKDGSWYCVGLISAGVQNCRAIGVPSIFTRVPHYLQWILANLRP